METLPAEMKLNILKYVDQKNLLFPVSCLNRDWKSLAFQNKFWKEVTFDQTDDQDDILRVIHNVPEFDVFSMSGVTNVSEILESLIKYCNRLKQLKITFMDCIITSSVFSNLVCKFDQISALSLEGVQAISVEALAAIENLVFLQNLNVSHCHQLSPEVLKSYATNLVHLHSLNIDGITSIDDESMIFLCRERQQLRSLQIDGEALTDASFIALSRLVNLELLSISFADNMTDVGLHELSRLSELQLLRLRRGKQLSPRALMELFETPLDTPRKLFYLDLSDCHNLTDLGVLSICSYCPRLCHLNLSWCWEITDEGIDIVVESCRYLHKLLLTGLAQVTGVSFLKIPTKLPYLKYLDLEVCNEVDDAMLCELASKKHDLVVKNYYGYEIVHDEELKDEDDQTGSAVEISAQDA